MRSMFFVVAMALFSGAGWAETFSIGAGGFDLGSDYCSRCDGDGLVLEVLHQTNRWVAAEAKFGRGDIDGGGNASFVYAGVNISPAIGPEWLTIYGKLGGVLGRFEKTLLTGYDNDGEAIFEKRHQDFSAAYGVGVMIRISSWYGKIETIRSRVDGADIDLANLTIGIVF